MTYSRFKPYDHRVKAVASVPLAAIAVLFATGIASAAPDMTAASARDIALTYLRALPGRDDDTVPFAPDCTRVENGVVTGLSGADLANYMDTGSQSQTVLRIYNLTFADTADGVTAHYNVDGGILGTRIATDDVTERFVVANGQIKYIEATNVPTLAALPDRPGTIVLYNR